MLLRWAFSLVITVQPDLSWIMNVVPRIPSVLEYCRLCNEKKAPVVDIFSTMVYRDGCSLAKKLNELYGIEASSPDDDLSKFICTECLRQIMRHGNLSYNLWSTLDYLMKMHAEEVMDISSYDIPEDSLDFLFSREKDYSFQPLVLEKIDQPPFSSCGKMDKGRLVGSFTAERAGIDIEEEEMPKVEFCWCTECNEEFLCREELRLHSRKHAETGTPDRFEQNDDLILSSEEYKLLSGQVSLMKNKLCCSKCQKEFASERKLVRHVNKYDFQCEHRSFVNLNNQLKILKTKRAEDSALMDTQGRDSTFHVNSKLCEATPPLTRDSLDNSNVILIKNKCISDTCGELSVSDVNLKAKQRKFSEKKQRHAGSNSSSARFWKQDEALLKTTSNEGAETVNHETLKTELNVSERVVICDYCTKPHSLKSQLREHIVLCHLSVVSHRCSICHTFFLTESELKVHEAIHFSKSKYLCSLCHGNFSSRAKVSMHLKNVHNMDKLHACSACFLCFPSKPELALHQHCHSLDSKKYCCPKCGKRFLNKSYYRIHVSACQLGQLLHKCDQCGKECLTRGNMKIHLLSHDPDRTLACLMCPRKFLMSGDLSLHIRSFHLKLRPHECGICKKRFAVRRYLRIQYAVHSDDRPFKCKHCEKCYKTKAVLYVHTKNLHIKV
ncbi:zinc finger protein 62 homolog isoform X3 [Ischnura elegans]|uniref:zinc finger protein 62 homolog isoform X3 n=1 Tax=Ischnura elegans TaxID=197161 RepID=UPI001ED87D77|nr:zinc finger protein 62 homolog isoform X3 [Ischnura elegans]